MIYERSFPSLYLSCCESRTPKKWLSPPRSSEEPLRGALGAETDARYFVSSGKVLEEHILELSFGKGLQIISDFQ